MTRKIPADRLVRNVTYYSRPFSFHVYPLCIYIYTRPRYTFYLRFSLRYETIYIQRSTTEGEKEEKGRTRREDPFKKEREAVVEEKKKCETINAKGVRSEIAER